MNKLISTLLISHLLILSLGSAQSTKEKKTASQEPIRIGAITSLTGRFATFGKMQEAGFKVALEEINQKAGQNGQKFKLLLEDDGSDVNKALNAAEKLVNQNTPIIIGSFSSGITKPLSRYMVRAKVPLLVATAVDETITKPGNPYTFRVNNQSSVYLQSLIKQLKELPQIKTAVVLTGNDAFGKSVYKDARALLPKAGIKVLSQDTYDKGLTDFRPLLNRFKSKNPDVVILASYEQDAVALTKQVKEIGLKPKVIAGIATGFALPKYLQGVGADAEGFLVPMVWNPDVKYKGAQNLHKRLKKALKGQEPSQHAAQSYAALLTAAHAIQQAGTEPKKVREALNQLKLNTAFGPVSFQNFNGYQNQNKVVGLITQIQNGQFVTVAPKTVSTGTLMIQKK